MSAPKLAYYLFDGSTETPMTRIDFQAQGSSGGAVKAGTTSRQYEVRIYNDHGNTDATTAEATDVDITLVGASGDNAVITQQWCQAQDGLVGSPPWTPIGGVEGVLAFATPIPRLGYQPVSLRMAVPSNAPALTYPFILRVSYSYAG